MWPLNPSGAECEQGCSSCLSPLLPTVCPGHGLVTSCHQHPSLSCDDQNCLRAASVCVRSITPGGQPLASHGPHFLGLACSAARLSTCEGFLCGRQQAASIGETACSGGLGSWSPRPGSSLSHRCSQQSPHLFLLSRAESMKPASCSLPGEFGTLSLFPSYSEGSGPRKCTQGCALQPCSDQKWTVISSGCSPRGWSCTPGVPHTPGQ